MDDRNRRRHLHHGLCRRGRYHDDDVGLERDHLPSKLLEPLRAAFCVTALINYVLSLHVAQLAQTLEQRVVKTLVSVCDEAKAPNLAWLLRARRDWPRRRAAEQHDEVASLHCLSRLAITSLTIKTSNVRRPKSGTVRHLRTAKISGRPRRRWVNRVSLTMSASLPLIPR